MTKPKYLPGPWRIHSASSTLIIDVSGNVIADALGSDGRDFEVVKANAKLIATAPDLLGALEGVTRILAAFASTTQFGQSQRARLDAARAVIAKARGEA